MGCEIGSNLSHKRLIASVLIAVVTIPSVFLGLLYYQMSNIKVGAEFLSIPSMTIRLVFANPTSLDVDVTDIFTQLFIEDEFALETTISKLYIPAGMTIHKDLTLSSADVTHAWGLISQASTSYGGEVKIKLVGQGTAHLLFLSLRLPFSIEQYYMLGEASLGFDSARWTDVDGNTISATSKNTEVFVEVTVTNPTRKHDIAGSVDARVMRDIPFWYDEEIDRKTQSVTVSASSSEVITFSFSLTQASTYHFDIFINDRKVYTQPDTVPPRLQVHD